MNKKIIKCLKNSIAEKGNYCYSLPVETTKTVIKELNRLNNIINELEKWLEDNLGNCRTNQNYTSNQIYNLKEDTYYRCLDKLKALKENK